MQLLMAVALGENHIGSKPLAAAPSSPGVRFCPDPSAGLAVLSQEFKFLQRHQFP